MKLLKPTFLYSIGAVLLLTFMLNGFSALSKTWASQPDYVIDIATTPSSGFLTATNMAPGDEASSLLRVSNNGNLNFSYSVSPYLESGSSLLYSTLILTIQDQNGVLYQGDMAQLTNLDLGTLTAFQERDMQFTAKLPIQVGNEYQGLSSTVEFIFTAVSDFEPMNCSFDPPFSNNQFSYQLGSTVPIKFHCDGPNGEKIKTPREDARLVITGPNANPTVSYQFAYIDGTLEFNGDHYQRNFNSDEYPLVNQHFYTAKVYYGDQLVITREFQAVKSGNRSNASK